MMTAMIADSQTGSLVWTKVHIRRLHEVPQRDSSAWSTDDSGCYGQLFHPSLESGEGGASRSAESGISAVLPSTPSSMT